METKHEFKHVVYHYLNGTIPCKITRGEAPYFIPGAAPDIKFLTPTLFHLYSVDKVDIIPFLRPIKSMNLVEAHWILTKVYFPHAQYPMKDFKIELVGMGDEKHNPRISIDNDWYQEELTFGNKTGSVWATKGPAHNFKCSPEIFVFLLRQGFDLFGLIESGQAIDVIKNPI